MKIDPRRIIRSAAKARASSDEERIELESLFGETWAKAASEYRPGPAALETLVYTRMEQDYFNWLRDKGRHPAGMTGVADSPVEVISLDDDLGDDDEGEPRTRHEVTAYPSDATPQGYADPAIEMELEGARKFADSVIGSDQNRQRHAYHAARYHAPIDRDTWISGLTANRFPRHLIENAVDAMLALPSVRSDKRLQKAWRDDAFAKGAGARARDARLPKIHATAPINVEAARRPDYKGFSSRITARLGGSPTILSPNTPRHLRDRTLDWITPPGTEQPQEYGKPVALKETPAEGAAIAAYLRRQPEPFMAPQIADSESDGPLNTFGDDQRGVGMLFDSNGL